MVRNIILNYKFYNKSYIYKTIVNFLLKNEKFFEKIKCYDTIIPVPISKERFKQRGYNQSALIAKELVKELKTKNIDGIEYNEKCLFKVKNITQQSKLNKWQRKINIQGVYQLKNKEILYNRKILIIDDIYTTGSTVNECSKTLIQANPKKIGILTIAKD